MAGAEVPHDINPLDAGTVADHDRQVADMIVGILNPRQTAPAAGTTVDYLLREAVRHALFMERARLWRAERREVVA